MKWFRSLFTNNSVSEKLKHIACYLPEYYKQDIQFRYFNEFMKQCEWGLAAESLVELSITSEHYFSPEYWNYLSNIFLAMGIKENYSFFRKQIEETSKVIPFKIPFGQTVDKVSDTLFAHYIAEVVKDKWVRERHERDNIEKLSGSDGTYFKFYGRSGYLYIVKNRCVAEVFLEMELNGWRVYFPEKLSWVYSYQPSQTEINIETIKFEIKQWSEDNNIPIFF